MPLVERQKAINNIAHVLAVTQYDIELHQGISDYSLNIHSENYFRDVLNFIYNLELENTNFHTTNFPCIDLVDDKAQIAVQISTTTTKDKIIKTLGVLTIGKYSNYHVWLYYLIGKPKLQKKTVLQLESKYNQKMKESLLDMNSILKQINDLPTERVVELNQKYFIRANEKYTDKKILDLTIRHILENRKHEIKQYDDSFGSIETDSKMLLNGLNSRISGHINTGLDYRTVLQKIDENIVKELRDFIICDLYREILIGYLPKNTSKYTDNTIEDLHKIAKEMKLNFNKIINALSIKINSYIEPADFNSFDVSWVIIAFFFEICDIGQHK